jgi:glutaredoxin
MTNPITMYGTPTCSDCHRAKAVFATHDVDYEWIDVSVDGASAERAREISGRGNIPVVVFPDGTHQVEPSNPDLEAKLRELELIAR